MFFASDKQDGSVCERMRKLDRSLQSKKLAKPLRNAGRGISWGGAVFPYHEHRPWYPTTTTQPKQLPICTINALIKTLDRAK